MSGSANLHIFPQPPTGSSRPSPRKTRPSNDNELRGLALQITTTTSDTQPRIQPASNTVQHASAKDCPPSAVSSSSSGYPRRGLSQRRRSLTASPSTASIMSKHTSPIPEGRELPALPSNRTFATSAPNQDPAPVESVPASIPAKLSTTNLTKYGTQHNQNITDKGARATPPARTKASEFSPSTGIAPSFRSRSPTLVRANSAATSRTYVSPASETSQPLRSIFPQFDPSKSLSQQPYYPPPGAVSPPVMPRVQLSKPGASPEAPPLIRKDSAITFDSGYECIPCGTSEDLNALWVASSRAGACDGRKVQLSLYQPPNSGTSLNISVDGRMLYDMTTESSNASKSSDPRKEVIIRRINPDDKSSQPVANILLPSKAPNVDEHTTIFPHQAAVDSLSAASNSPQAAEIARFDPSATSRAAERLAKDAMIDAHRHHKAELVRATRCRDSLGAVTAQYKLRHAILGDFPITVKQSNGSRDPYIMREPKAKISVHHHTATPAAIAADSLALITLDFGRDACIVDLPGILNLEAEYMLDLAMSAVFATAVLENDGLREQYQHQQKEVMTFAAPPKTAITDPADSAKGKLRKSAKKSKTKQKSRWLPRKTGVVELDEQVEEMPSVAKGALAIISLSVHGAFWLLTKGVKALDEKTSGRI